MSPYRVSNTTGTNGYPSAVRVYIGGKLIGEVLINCSNPLGYLRARNKSKHIDSLRKQCLAGGMSLTDFNKEVMGR